MNIKTKRKINISFPLKFVIPTRNECELLWNVHPSVRESFCHSGNYFEPGDKLKNKIFSPKNLVKVLFVLTEEIVLEKKKERKEIVNPQQVLKRKKVFLV